MVVVGRDHPVAAYDEVDLADLAGEQFIGGPPDDLTLTVEQLDFPPMTAQDSVEVVAAGTGVVVPMSVARLHHRRDVVHRPVRGLPPTTIALVWLVERDDEVTQAFVGVVRGRTPGASRLNPTTGSSTKLTTPGDLPRLYSTNQLRRGWRTSCPGSSPRWPTPPGATWWPG